MPYADPEKRRAAQREYYRKKYQASKEFREYEAWRKAQWYQQPEVKAHRCAMLREWRERAREIRQSERALEICDQLENLYDELDALTASS